MRRTTIAAIATVAMLAALPAGAQSQKNTETTKSYIAGLEQFAAGFFQSGFFAAQVSVRVLHA